jgi:hypothetical protein
MLRNIKKILKLFNSPILPRLSSGEYPREMLERRVMRRFKAKMSEAFPNDSADFSFEELFKLPPWITLDEWIIIQLRGRPLNSLIELTIDHIVPIKWCRTPDELRKLMSWENTRFLDKELNSRKSDYKDEENIELCYAFLARYPNEAKQRVDEYKQQRDAQSGDRFAKLMSRAKGKSQRMQINGSSAMQKKKDYRNKKRR